MKAANLVVRLLLELGALVGLAVAGWRLGAGSAARLGLAVAAPAVFAAVWGALVAPKARRRLADPARLGLEVVLFALVGAALVVAGAPLIAGAFVLVVAAHLALMVRWDQRGW